MSYKPLLRVSEVERKTGVTRKQLRYWGELGILQPQWNGTHRGYGPAELKQLERVQRLLAVGYKPKQVQAILFAEQALPERSVTEKELYQRLLKAGKPAEIAVGTDFQTYNTAYKRLHRLAREMGIDIATHKQGDSLTVSAIPARRARGRTKPERNGPEKN